MIKTFVREWAGKGYQFWLFWQQLSILNQVSACVCVLSDGMIFSQSLLLLLFIEKSFFFSFFKVYLDLINALIILFVFVDHSVLTFSCDIGLCSKHAALIPRKKIQYLIKIPSIFFCYINIYKSVLRIDCEFSIYGVYVIRVKVICFTRLTWSQKILKKSHPQVKTNRPQQTRCMNITII